MSDKEVCSNECSDGAQTESDPYYVGKRDEHTGVGDVFGIPYTYEHVEDVPEPDVALYQITAIVTYDDRPTHKNTYYVRPDQLDQFFLGYGETWEVVIDIRPADSSTAARRIAEYRGGFDYATDEQPGRRGWGGVDE